MDGSDYLQQANFHCSLLKMSFFREEVISFPLEAASREQKQFDVCCERGRERTPHPLRVQTKPRREKITRAWLPEAAENRNISLREEKMFRAGKPALLLLLEKL